MDLPKELLTDPRFLEVVGLLLMGRREVQDSEPAEDDDPDDVTRRIRWLITLRIKRQGKQRK
jgi:hypothetical protein